MKCIARIILIALSVIAVSFGVVGIIYAATTADIVVSATGYIVATPSGLTLTYESDDEVGISWIKGVDATATMIRALKSTYPTLTSGRLVYSGNSTHCIDEGAGWLDDEDEILFYKAWSTKDGILWQSASSSEEVFLPPMPVGETLFICLFIALAILIMLASYRMRIRWLLFIPMLLWLSLAVWSWGRDDTHAISPYDVFWIMRNLGLAMAIVCAGLVAAFNVRRLESGELDREQRRADVEESRQLSVLMQDNRYNRSYFKFKNRLNAIEEKEKRERRSRGEWVDEG